MKYKLLTAIIFSSIISLSACAKENSSSNDSEKQTTTSSSIADSSKVEDDFQTSSTIVNKATLDDNVVTGVCYTFSVDTDIWTISDSKNFDAMDCALLAESETNIMPMFTVTSSATSQVGTDNIDTYVDLMENQYTQMDNYNLISSEELTVKDKTGHVFDIEYAQEDIETSRMEIAVFIENDYLITIYCSAYEQDYEALKDSIDEMVNSFEFTKT